MSKKLDHKIALITGASKGIGAATAIKLASEGAHVLINFKQDDIGAASVYQKIVASGGQATVFKADITKKTDLDMLFEFIKQKFGALDILVNNAGIYQFSSMEQLSEFSMREHFEINFFALVNCIQRALPIFNPQGATIVNLSSIDARFQPLHGSIYSASKAAVDSLTKSLAKELGPRNIRVNAVAPGLVATEGTKSGGFLEPEYLDQLAKEIPLGRIGEPEDVAKTIFFLVSEDSQWLSGETILLAGGLRIPF